MDSREFSVGEIVDYMPGFPDPEVMEVCVWFEKARVQPITLSETLFKARGIAIALGTKFLAIIDVEALDEFFVNPSNIMVAEENIRSIK
jgi:hypothetical protein